MIFWNFCVAEQKAAEEPPADLRVFFEEKVAKFFELDSIKGFLTGYLQIQ